MDIFTFAAHAAVALKRCRDDVEVFALVGVVVFMPYSHRFGFPLV